MDGEKEVSAAIKCIIHSDDIDFSEAEHSSNEQIRDERIVYSRQELFELIEDHETSTVTKFTPQADAKYVIGQGKCKGKVHWNPDTQIPYVVTGYLRWYCQHSKDRHRMKNKKLQEFDGDNVERSKYNRVKQPSKRDCKAYIVASQITQFPKYKHLFTDSRRLRKNTNDMILGLLKEDSSKLEKETFFRVSLPPLSSHTGHEVGESAGKLQRLDKQIIDKIYQFVLVGVTSPKKIQNLLEIYVVAELFKDRTPPLPSNRRFFPSIVAIRNHVYNARLKLKAKERGADEKVIVTLTDNDAAQPLELYAVNESSSDRPPSTSTAPTPRHQPTAQQILSPRQRRRQITKEPQTIPVTIDSFALANHEGQTILTFSPEQADFLRRYEEIVIEELPDQHPVFSEQYSEISAGVEDAARHQPETPQRRSLTNIIGTLTQIRDACTDEASLDVLQESEEELQAVLNRMLQARITQGSSEPSFAVARPTTSGKRVAISQLGEANKRRRKT